MKPADVEGLVRAVTALLDEAMVEAPDGGWWQQAREPGDALVRVVMGKLKRARTAGGYAGRIRRVEVVSALETAYTRRAEALFGQSNGVS